MKLYIARHAETTWNLAGRYQGRRESALSARGIQQGLALADAFAQATPMPERIIASPMQRTRTTATFGSSPRSTRSICSNSIRR